jgi:hypothetical protein
VFNLQGLVLFALYAAGIVSAMAVAWVYRRGARRRRLPRRCCWSCRPTAGRTRASWRSACGSAPASSCARGRHHPGADGAAVVPVQLSRRPPGADRGRPSSTALPAALGALEKLLAPIGFNWQICHRPGARAWRRAKWPWARWARCTRCRPAGRRRFAAGCGPEQPGHRAGVAPVRLIAAVRGHAGRWPRRCRCWPGSCTCAAVRPAPRCPHGFRRGRRKQEDPSVFFASSANPWRPLRMAVHFSRGACRDTALIECLTIIREKSQKTGLSA